MMFCMKRKYNLFSNKYFLNPMETIFTSHGMLITLYISPKYFQLYKKHTLALKNILWVGKTCTCGTTLENPTLSY